jgi:hypothetical protein
MPTKIAKQKMPIEIRVRHQRLGFSGFVITVKGFVKRTEGRQVHFPAAFLSCVASTDNSSLVIAGVAF